MVDAAFHLSEEFITEDLDYYFSGERDKNNQIRPDDNIISTTPLSTVLDSEMQHGQVCNFFYPTIPNYLDRIFIGISIPLFANNWGASFLLELLKVLKPGGEIILPVYPEGQAQEKGYWSRSFLENIFLSRQRWTGFSNVNAENDGVMSLKVGRKWPDPIPGTIEWFYSQRANLMLQHVLQSDSENAKQEFVKIVEMVWKNYTQSALVERIIQDHYGAKNSLSVQVVSQDYGLLLTDLLFSPYIRVKSGKTVHLSKHEDSVAKNFNSFFRKLKTNMKYN